MLKFIIILLSLVNISFATKIPDNFKVDQKTLNLLQKIKDFPMDNREDGGYYLFYYSEELANIVNKHEGYMGLDPKKATKLAPNVLGVGLSITQSKPATDKQFEEYHCAFHLFVPQRDDYWLPEGNYGDWFSDLEMRDQFLKFTGVSIGLDKAMRGYSQRTAMTGTSGILLERFKKNIFPKVLYLKLGTLCASMPHPGRDHEIWLEKTGGIDYTRTHIAGFEEQYFHTFLIPQALIDNSCKYLQKAHYLEKFNWDLEHAYNFYPEESTILSARELYPCNN